MSFPICWVTNQLNPLDNPRAPPRASLSHNASGSCWRWKTFKGPHNLSPTTVEVAIVFHWNGETRVESIVRGSLQMPLLSSDLWTESSSSPGKQDFQQEESLICYARKHSKFNVPELSVKVGQLSVCLSLWSFHECVVCFIATHVCFYRLL